jgi:hypothetical protein
VVAFYGARMTEPDVDVDVDAVDVDLDALIDELLPLLSGGGKSAGRRAFLFDPSELAGLARHSYPEYLRWLGIPEETLPPERLFIHAGHGHPATLERRDRFSLFLDSGLYRSRDAVRMALAHETTHLYLTLNDLQRMVPGGDKTAHSHAWQALEEVRTEVASICLGLGKLVLNGVCAYRELEAADGYDSRLGYLSVASFAYVYRRVNELAEVDPRDAESGLNDAARRALTVR